jgi:hypothetical protein
MLEKIDILLQEKLLDDWSRGFLESLKDQIVRRSVKAEEGIEIDLFSDRQKATFNKIQSRFSPQEKAKLERWAEDYKKDHKERAKVIARYYSLTPYFNDIAHKVLQDEDYVPDMHRFKKMSENKYADGVWNNWISEPRFADGTMVQIRKESFKADRLGYVLSSKEPVKSHGKGGKCYLILLFGSTQTIIREERQLKKPNKNGKYV